MYLPATRDIEPVVIFIIDRSNFEVQMDRTLLMQARESLFESYCSGCTVIVKGKSQEEETLNLVIFTTGMGKLYPVSAINYFFGKK